MKTVHLVVTAELFDDGPHVIRPIGVDVEIPVGYVVTEVALYDGNTEVESMAIDHEFIETEEERIERGFESDAHDYAARFRVPIREARERVRRSAAARQAFIDGDDGEGEGRVASLARGAYTLVLGKRTRPRNPGSICGALSQTAPATLSAGLGIFAALGVVVLAGAPWPFAVLAGVAAALAVLGILTSGRLDE